MWNEEKEKIIKKLEKDILESKVDKDIIPLLQTINSFPEYVTLSSCSGRAMVIDLPRFGLKKEAKIISKWHAKVCAEEVEKTLKKCEKEGWFIVQPAILHVSCKTLESAEKLLKIANETGFRESGIISLKRNVVRIYSAERIETILSKNGKILVESEYIKILVKIANEKLEKVKEKLSNLTKKLEKSRKC